MAILNKNIYIVAGATSGIGKEIGKFIEGDYYPIGGRDIQTLAEIAATANKKGFFIPGNLFDPQSGAYNFFIEELGPQNYTGVVQFFASVDMDPIPIEEDGVIIADYFDPRNGQKWDAAITMEEKRQIRMEMADSQILFWKNFLESLLKRTAKGSLMILYANSIISKFYENHSFRRHSEYGRLKNTFTQLIEEYRERLEEKNVFIKNILLGITDTPMFYRRGKISAEKTRKIVEVVAPNIPLAGEEITATELLNPKEVASFLYKISNIYAKATPNKINLFHPRHFDIETLIRNFVDKKNKIMKEMVNQSIVHKENHTILMDERVKDFLIKLRVDSLKKYYETNKKNNNRINETKLRDNIIMGEKIIKTLAPQLSTDNFLDACIRLEGNYP